MKPLSTRWLHSFSPLLLILCLVACQAQAQQTVTVDAAEREAVVAGISEMLIDNYVFPEVAEASAKHLQDQLAAGAFDSLTSAESFAKKLTEALQSVTHDKHMRVRVRPSDTVQMGEEDPEAAMAQQRRRMRANNYGFARVEHLEGNVGYLDLRGFFAVDLARETATAAMGFLANADAVIIDLRRNGGGSPAMVQLLCSYFFDEPTHLNSLYWRQGDRTEEFWTLDTVAGRKMPDVPLYVLTSDYTFSGAEEFAYNMQTRKRATLVGETTGGGANPGGTFPINDRFGIFIPTGRAVNPVTGTNWEGIGVEPEVKVAADQALDKALVLAQEAARTYRAAAEAQETAARAALRTDLERAAALFESGKAQEGTALVETALKHSLSAYAIDEMGINMTGYRALQSGHTKLAIAVFAFNVQAFPASSNVYDSLGEAYMEDGQREPAITHYKKSLELDPHNENAVRMLAKLGVEVSGR